MDVYELIKFVRIVGALGLVGAFALEWHLVVRLRRSATAEQVREALGVAKGVETARAGRR